MAGLRGGSKPMLTVVDYWRVTARRVHAHASGLDREHRRHPPFCGPALYGHRGSRPLAGENKGAGYHCHCTPAWMRP
jgi:hypothetical protein